MTTTKITIELGRELAYYANNITNVFTTKDYIGDIIDLYKDHVLNFYDPDFDNDFTMIHKFKSVISNPDFVPEPYDSPLDGMDDVKDLLEHIIDNKSAYSLVIKNLMSDCRDGNYAGSLIYDLLSVLKSSSRGFIDTATLYDRYMGLHFSITDVIRTVYAYGKLTGLVDYYNMEEGKDG
mgnify:CR=1 FL=1